MSKIFQKYFKKFPKFPKISKKNQKKFKKIVRKNVKKIFQKCDAEDFGRQKIILMAKSQFFRFFWGTRYKIQKIFRTLLRSGIKYFRDVPRFSSYLTRYTHTYIYLLYKRKSI